jgi:hypothetical protein
MGVHSLGGAQAANSGYRGKWTGVQNAGFSEVYYLNMINATNKWINVVRPSYFVVAVCTTSGESGNVWFGCDCTYVRRPVNPEMCGSVVTVHKCDVR